MSSTKQVSQYSGVKSGITTTDIDSKEREYKILYTGLDDSLTKKAVENVNQMEKFGSGDTKGLSQDEESKTNAGAKYKIFVNDCNDYTSAVFKEYEKLWKDDFMSKNTNADDKQVNKAWMDHYKKISKNGGEWLTIEK